MAHVLLKDHDRAGRCWVLDTASGDARPGDSGVCHGFLSAFPGYDGDAAVTRVAAVYADGGRLWFQLDARRWEVENVDFEHRLDGSGLSQFTLLGYGEIVADIVYLGPAADPVNRHDPSFDELDMELQDIFYYLARNSRSPTWRTGVLTLWSGGFAGGR